MATVKRVCVVLAAVTSLLALPGIAAAEPSDIAYVLTSTAAAGANRLSFGARVRRLLTTGSYRAVVTATDATGDRSRAARARFRAR